MHNKKPIRESEKSQPVTFASLSMIEMLRTESDFPSQLLIDKLIQEELSYMESKNVIAFLHYSLILVSAEQEYVFTRLCESSVCFLQGILTLTSQIWKHMFSFLKIRKISKIKVYPHWINTVIHSLSRAQSKSVNGHHL